MKPKLAALAILMIASHDMRAAPILKKLRHGLPTKQDAKMLWQRFVGKAIVLITKK